MASPSSAKSEIAAACVRFVRMYRAAPPSEEACALTPGGASPPCEGAGALTPGRSSSPGDAGGGHAFASPPGDGAGEGTGASSSGERDGASTPVCGVPTSDAETLPDFDGFELPWVDAPRSPVVDAPPAPLVVVDAPPAPVVRAPPAAILDEIAAGWIPDEREFTGAKNVAEDFTDSGIMLMTLITDEVWTDNPRQFQKYARNMDTSEPSATAVRRAVQKLNVQAHDPDHRARTIIRLATTQPLCLARAMIKMKESLRVQGDRFFRMNNKSRRRAVARVAARRPRVITRLTNKVILLKRLATLRSH